MARTLAVVERITNGWTPEQIAAGLARPRFNSNEVEKPSNPIPELERSRAWWRGAILTRHCFLQVDRDRAKRMGEMSVSVDNSPDTPVELRYAQTIRQQDMSFMALAGKAAILAIAEQHAKAITEYERRMGAADRYK